MKIGIDLRALPDKPDNFTGVSNYAFLLTKYLLRIQTPHRFVLFVRGSLRGGASRRGNPLAREIASPPLGDRNDGVEVVEIPPKRLPFYDAHIRDARLFKRAKLDVFHSPAFTLPYLFTLQPNKLRSYNLLPRKTVVTIHDLAIYRHPEWFPSGQWFSKKILVPGSIKKADHIIVPSEATKKDLMELFGVGDEKVSVIPLGVEARFFEAGNSKHEARSTKQIQNSNDRNSKCLEFNDSDLDIVSDFDIRISDLRKDYILSVATLEPRKNLVRLIQAYASLPKDLTDKYDLVIAGAKGWKYEGIEEVIRDQQLEIRDKIRLIGPISHDKLPSLYQNASLFCFPSLYEGFGLPVLEAMAAGVPVVTSKNTPMAEILAGKFEARSTKHETNSKQINSKLKTVSDFEHSNLDIVSNFGFRISDFLVNPYSVNSISQAMEKALRGDNREMARMGIERAREYTWDNTAKKTLQVYDRLLNS